MNFLYVASMFNILLAICLFVLSIYGFKHAPEQRSKHCFVLPIAYSMGYFVLELEWIKFIGVEHHTSVVRSMAWNILNGSSIVYMMHITLHNIHYKRVSDDS